METVTTNTMNLFERFNRWIQESIMVKLFSIGFLILILLIPAAWIQDLISERQQRADEVVQEVANKWSGSQKISGPVLVIPYTKQQKIDRGKDGIEVLEYTEKAFFLPEQLSIDGKVSPETLQRGIFDAVVYQSSLQIESVFNKPDFNALSIPENKVIWKDAYMVFGITDLRGINENPTFTVGGKQMETDPSNNIGVSVQMPSAVTSSTDYTYSSTSQQLESTNGIVAKLHWENEESFNGIVSIKLGLKGSNRLDFVPAGKTTDVKLNSPWPDPSFDGAFLPMPREVTENGFTASWKVLHFNRPFSQSWTNANQPLSGADFGVKLLIPVDQYQKSMRTSKYGVLVILLTFIALLMVEITQKIRIHPFQYILIGAALTIYYTLLLSFSEHLGFNVAYIIAGVSTIALITLYSMSFLPTKKLVAMFSVLLSIFYTFIFLIILQQDYSLLLGSIGLFLIVGVVMYFSRKVKWYGDLNVNNG